VEEFLNSISGAAELFAWFGFWPDFHDAEIISLALNRSGISTLQIHTWQMTDQVDEKGYYILKKHVLVNFQMEDVLDLELVDFSPQNVISGLILKKAKDGILLELGPCYGLAGSISARKLSIGIEPISG
jgi:hypothetical protein